MVAICIGSNQPSIGLAFESIGAAEATAHIGETATVCGVVASAKFAVRTRGQPTFLNFDKPYPNQLFTAVIWGADREKFGTPESTYSHGHICVSGRIKAYRGLPEMNLRNPSQISVSP